MGSKFLKLREQNMSLKKELEVAFERVLRSGNYVSGVEVQSFEEAFANLQGVKHAIACNSGTSAIYLSLLALGIGRGDEVVVPGMTFVATIEAVVQAGATPVVADVDNRFLNLSVASIQEAISERTKAVIFVHLHGNASGIVGVADFCLSKGIHLIEDAAQAHLSGHSGLFVGNFGSLAAFSFYPGKNLGAIGEGGCVTTNDAELAERVRLSRNWGSRKKYVYEVRGGNYRMDELQAAFLSVKLGKLKTWTEIRIRLAGEYFSALSSSSISLPEIEFGASHVFHIFAVRTKSRDSLKESLQQNAIETGIHYPSAIAELEPWIPYFRVNGCQINSIDAANQLLSLPISEFHTKEEIDSISDLIINHLN